MKFQFFKALIILSILSQLLLSQTPPSITIESDTKWLTEVPSAYANGVFYLEDVNLIFFPQNSTMEYIGIPEFCTSQPWLSSNGTPYCMTYEYKFGYTLSELDPYAQSIVNNYTFNNPGNKETLQLMGQLTEGDYIIYIFLSQLRENGIFNLVIFNTKTKSFECPGGMAYNFKLQVKAAFVSQGYLFYAEDGASKTTLDAINCTTGEIVYSVDSMIYESEIDGYLSSTVFLSLEEDHQSLIKAFQMTENSTFIFGESIPYTQYSRISDSEFITMNSTAINATVYRYQVTSQLTFQLLSSFSVLNDNIGFNTAVGLPYLYMSHYDSSVVVYDYNTGEVVQVLSPLPPFVLANGSSLNMTQFGYFLSNPGDEQIYFIWAPNQMTFTYFPDREQFASILVPQASVVVSKICNLLLINQSTSSIEQFQFQNCPGYLFTNFLVKDVAMDQNGSINVLYRDSSNRIYIVNSQNVVGPLNPTLFDAFVSASMNFTTGLCTFAATQATSGFVLGQFWLNNGSVLNSTTVASGKFGYTYRLSSRYFLLASANLTNSSFMVWDSIEGDVFGQITLNFTLGVSKTAPFIPLGVDESLPSVYSGLVILAEAQAFALVNADGEYGLFDDVVFETEILARDKNSFWGISIPAETGVNHMKLYNVTNWNLDLDL